MSSEIRLIVLDVDGTLTDGLIIYDSAGNDARHFHAADGLGIVMAQAVGMTVAVISGRRSAAVERRLAELKITDVVQASGDKATALREMMTRHHVTADQVAFIGDDLNDLPAFDVAGWTATVSDGAPQIRERADYVAPRPGGHGGVRDVIEEILRRQGCLDQAIHAYLDRIAMPAAPRQ